MRILHISPSYAPAWRYGGPAFSVHNLCKSLVLLGHEVRVLTTNLNGNQYLDVPTAQWTLLDGVSVQYCSVPLLRKIYYSPQLVHSLSEESNAADIIHIHTVFCWPSSIAAYIARKGQKPYIISPRGMLIQEMIEKKNRLLKHAWLSGIDRKNLGKASALHLTSDAEMIQTYKNKLVLPPAFVVPNGIDPLVWEAMKTTAWDRSRRGLAQKIVYLGRINWKKGIDRLIEAMKFIKDATLLIVGNDDENYTPFLKKLANRHRVSARIHFSGPVYGAEKLQLLSDSDAFVLPSHSENFGNSVLEAMAMGCPVIITPEVALSQIISRENAGLVVDGNPVALGKAINSLLKNHVLRKELSINAEKVLKRYFDPTIIAKTMEQHYRRLIIL